jgi:ring-1,2-phenylacetyl-CoA epoxidase subunit PaaB
MGAPDTQWPRYEVFQQRREGGAYQNVGSVHAPDAEIALQNARDVFVRRPQTVGLWVVPAGAILARTQEELAEDDAWRDPEPTIPGAREQTYYVFQKRSQRRSMGYVTHTGEVQAPTIAHALLRAWEKDAGEKVYVWWVVPARAIVGSEETDVESMFRPAEDKGYRMPTAYHTHTLMREVKKKGEDES